jgi:putative toxin-antitoxin system antitoxin component (TIGR02293 family)
MTKRGNFKKKTELSDRTPVPRPAAAKAQLSKRSATPVKGIVTKKAKQSTIISPRSVYTASGVERIAMIRRGVPAVALNEIVRKMAISKERLYATLRFPTSTIDRKIRNNDALSAEHSERLLGLERLIGQVEVMLSQSGTGEKFDADRWVGAWLDHPLPALGGARPAEYMDTIEGQELVSGLLAQSQSGAYG